MANGVRFGPQRRRSIPAGGAVLRGLVAWLCGVMMLVFGPACVGAIGGSSRVTLAQLRLPKVDLDRKMALQRLSWVVQKRTSISMAVQVVQVELTSKDLFRYPFLYLCGDEAFALPPPEQIARLRRYLQFGGTLLVDSAEARPGGPFDVAVRRLAKAVFPDKKLANISSGHTLHKSFYLLGAAVGRVAIAPTLVGIARDGRYSFIYSQNDLGGAWARDAFGQWEHDVFPGGARQRELAFRWGINLLMYALCVDYKTDQVHIPFILKRRRWR